MTAAQRDLLMKLVDVYTGYMAADIAADRTAKLKKAGVEKIAFAWAGETERGKKHYYRVQGPTFLVEYDNTQNDGNHIHSVWRDFNGDFGRDLLREHLRSVAHWWYVPTKKDHQRSPLRPLKPLSCFFLLEFSASSACSAFKRHDPSSDSTKTHH